MATTSFWLDAGTSGVSGSTARTSPQPSTQTEIDVVPRFRRRSAAGPASAAATSGGAVDEVSAAAPGHADVGTGRTGAAATVVGTTTGGADVAGAVTVVGGTEAPRASPEGPAGVVAVD